MKMNNKKPREFSTENADYCLDYGVHIRTTKIDNIKDYDAIVLESGFHEYDDIHFNLKIKQYSEILKKNLELKEPKPIFYVDLPTKKFFRKQGIKGCYEAVALDSLSTAAPAAFAVTFIPFPFSLPFMLPIISRISHIFCGYNNKYDKIVSYIGLSSFYESGSFRSAASARKIEEIIVPGIRKKIKHKPNIFMTFGAGHCDLEPYLKHKKIRDFTIGYHKKIKLNTCDLSYLDKIGIATYKKFIKPKPDKK